MMCVRLYRSVGSCRGGPMRRERGESVEPLMAPNNAPETGLARQFRMAPVVRFGIRRLGGWSARRRASPGQAVKCAESASRPNPRLIRRRRCGVPMSWDCRRLSWKGLGCGRTGAIAPFFLPSLLPPTFPQSAPESNPRPTCWSYHALRRQLYRSISMCQASPGRASAVEAG